ncbi:MAG: CGNR zinc finger domain-containing protein [Acidimicrobiales bacterium]
MYLTSVTQSEIRATLEVVMEVANELSDGDPDLRALLSDAGFSRATQASAASVDRLAARMRLLVPLLNRLPNPDLDPAEAMAEVNEGLTELPISPSIAEHNGTGPHIHWTPATARFDDQVMSDVLMALAQELCDNSTDRFGQCGATDCSHLFYDNTRNNSRRFCSDPRCASRTHTADHRARRQVSSDKA